MIKIALLGYGTIGSGVAEVLDINHDSIAVKAGQEIEIKYILDLRDFPGDKNESKIVHDYEVIVNDPEVAVVVEAMGGVEPAYTFVKKALLAGKHVTTSNKALVAKHGPELLAIAREKQINFLFEASVGGGIPIIRPLISCLTADVVEEITGILNGTTNYMMTKMSEEGLEFDDVLKDAQQKGYAEADPTADIHCEGITNISAVDFKYAQAMGRSIKLLASSHLENGTYGAIVAPFLLEKSHPLYNVRDVFNAVFVHGNVLGDAMFYGSGAGKLPTASAVVADIVDIVKHIDKNIIIQWDAEKLKLADYKDVPYRFFVRTVAPKDEIEAAFGDVEYIAVPGEEKENAFVTGKMTGREYEKAAQSIGGIINMIRMD